MRILAIETVDKTGSVAVLEDGDVIGELALDAGRRSAQTLVPGIAALLKQVGWRAADVELAAVATGPGSFTGLRIGVTTAKTFAYATGCAVLGVHSMVAIGARVPRDVRRFSAVIDAQRNELFVAELARTADGKLTGEQSTRIVEAETWCDGLAPLSWVTGPGLVKWGEKLPTDVRMVDAGSWMPTAAVVGQSAWEAYTAGSRGDAWHLTPAYFRRTAAEEQWERRHGESGDGNEAADAK